MFLYYTEWNVGRRQNFRDLLWQATDVSNKQMKFDNLLCVHITRLRHTVAKCGNNKRAFQKSVYRLYVCVCVVMELNLVWSMPKNVLLLLSGVCTFLSKSKSVCIVESWWGEGRSYNSVNFSMNKRGNWVLGFSIWFSQCSVLLVFYKQKSSRYSFLDIALRICSFCHTRTSC